MKLYPENPKSAKDKRSYKNQIYGDLFPGYSGTSVAERNKISRLARFSSRLGKLKAEFGLGILVLAAKLKLRSFMFSDMTKEEFKVMFKDLVENEAFRATVEGISQNIVGVESRDIHLALKNAEENVEEIAEGSGCVGMEL